MAAWLAIFFLALTWPATAQIAPGAAELQAYRGLHAAAATGDAAAIERLVKGGAAIDARAGGADNAFTWIGSGAFSGVAGQLRAYSQAGNHYLAGDVNGDGLADFTIQTNVLLAVSDVVL